MNDKQPFKNRAERIEYDSIIYLINTEENTADVIGIKGNQQEIIIPRSIIYESKELYVRKILSNAFRNSKIEFIQFHSNSKLQTIDKYAFSSSTIKRIRIPSSVTSIGEYAFSKCNKLEVIEIPDDSKLQMIDKNAFSSSAIKSIRIPSAVTSIEEFAFSDCNKLEIIEIPDDSNLQTIKKYAFFFSAIKSIRIPSELADLKEGWCDCTSKITTISVSLENPRYFYYEDKMIIGKTSIEQSNYDCIIFCVRDIRQIKIPNFIEHICSHSFCQCKQLEIVDFSNDSKLQTIGKNAFSASAIKSIRIPPSVTSIGEYAFIFSRYFEVIEIPDDSELQIIDDFAFSWSIIKSIKIPSSVTSIGNNSFTNCTHLCIIEVANAEVFSMYQTVFCNCQNVLLMIPVHYYYFNS